MNWSAWLMALGGPLARRVLASLGIGMVSYAGMSALLESTFDLVVTQLAGLGAETAAILARGGVFDALAIGAGGMLAAASLLAFKRLGVLTGS